MPSFWPAELRQLISTCWHQDPTKRPGFGDVLKQLYAIRQASARLRAPLGGGVQYQQGRLAEGCDWGGDGGAGCGLMNALDAVPLLSPRHLP